MGRKRGGCHVHLIQFMPGVYLPSPINHTRNMNIPATENQNLNLCPSVYIIISFLFYADIFLSELWMKT